MDRRRFFAVATGLGAMGTAVPTPSWASIRAVGRVVGAQPGGKAEIRRRSGQRLAAGPGVLLFGGDVVSVTGEAQVVASIYGDIRIFDSSERFDPIPERPIGPITPEDEAYFDRFSGFVAEPPLALPSYRDAREPTKFDYSIRPSALAPPGPQWLIRGTPSAVLLWRGGSSRLSVTPASGESMPFSSGTNAWLRIKIPPQTDRIAVQLIDHPIEWSLELADKAWVEKRSGGRPIRDGYAGRLRWAHETLVAKRGQFDDVRIAALSILAEEAQRRDINNEFARLAWLAARNGRLES